MLHILGSSGCALISLPDPDDLALSSVAAVNSEDLSEYPWSSELLHPPAEEMLRVDFATRYDLFHAAHEYSIWNRVDFCKPDTDVYNSGVNWNLHVYWNKLNLDDLDAYAKNPELAKLYNSSTTRTFYVYIAVSHYESPNISHISGEPPALLYNLEEQPENVCLRVEGGTMLGQSFRSNTVFIPKEAIANALTAAR
jgi:hypothetical protein